MPAARARRAGQVAVEVHEDRAGKVARLVQLTAGRAAESPAHVEQRRRAAVGEQCGQFVSGYQGGAVIGHEVSMPRGTANPACGLTDARLARFGSAGSDEVRRIGSAVKPEPGDPEIPRKPEPKAARRV